MIQLHLNFEFQPADGELLGDSVKSRNEVRYLKKVSIFFMLFYYIWLVGNRYV